MKTRKSNTYGFICCPHGFFVNMWTGDKTGKGLQCTQLGDEVNRYSNLEEFSWRLIILKKKYGGAVNICFSSILITLLTCKSIELRLFERICKYMKMLK